MSRPWFSQFCEAGPSVVEAVEVVGGDDEEPLERQVALSGGRAAKLSQFPATMGASLTRPTHTPAPICTNPPALARSDGRFKNLCIRTPPSRRQPGSISIWSRVQRVGKFTSALRNLLNEIFHFHKLLFLFISWDSLFRIIFIFSSESS